MITHSRVWLILLSALLLFCLVSQQQWPLTSPLRVSFLDIGQGDCILIHAPHGRQVLIDGGPGSSILERLGEELPFWESDIDLMVLTHPDLDHLEGLVEVLERFRVRQVLLTGAVHGSRLYQAFQERLNEQEVPLFVADPEQDWQIDRGLVLDILGPTSSVALQEVDNANDASISMRVRYGQSSLLLTGDAEKAQEYELLRSGFDLSAQVFKAGHHGSSTSNDPTFVAAIDPFWSVVSSGFENPFDHPQLDPVLLFDKEGIEWWDTKQQGTITLASDGLGWWRTD